MSLFDTVYDQVPEGASRVRSPLYQPPRAVPRMETRHSVINNFATVSSSAEMGIGASHLFSSIPSFSPDILDPSGHLPHS